MNAIASASSTRRNRLCSLPAALWVAAACGLSAGAQSFISFNPTFDFGGLTAPQQTAFQASINSALSVYSTSLQTPSPLTVNILFKVDETISLGQSSTFVNNVPYAGFRSALAANSGSAADTAALAANPAGASNPVNGNSMVHTSLPLLRALGFAAEGDNSGGIDSEVSLKASIMNLERTGPQDSDKYDLQQVVWHEVNEVLGFTSTLNGLNNGDPAPVGAIGAADLFRYDISGIRSFTTSASANAYLSINGTTQLAQYNQTQGGDFQDFNGTPPMVQDAFSTPGLQLNMGPAELTALDVIGYNFAAVPEPGEVALAAAVGLIGFAAFRKFRAVSV